MATLPIEPNKYYTRLSIGPYKRDGDAFALSKFDPRLIVRLPIPDVMRDDTTVGYTNVNLETVGDAFLNNKNTTEAALLRGIGSLAQAGMSASSAGLDRATRNQGGVLGDIVNKAGGALLSAGQALFPAEQVSSAIQQKMGAAPNPNPSVQFQGPVLRDFTFTWVFYPRNKDESIEIDRLIRRLKARALPSENLSGGAILNYPHICQLNFYPWDDGEKIDEENGWSEKSIIKIKKCFMSGVNVNYMAYGGAPGFFENTYLPVTYTLTINFKEIEYLLSGDWDPVGENAAGERTQQSISGAAIVANATGEIIPELAKILVDTGKVALDLLTGNFPDKKDQDNFYEISDAIRAMTGAESKVVFKAEGKGLTQTSGEVTTTLTKEGKYVVVFQQTPETGKEFKIYEPVTLGTFDTSDQVNQYLVKERRVGPLTVPPPPKAKAAAPQ